MENAYIVVMVTTASKQEAEKIAQRVLNERLIACANIKEIERLARRLKESTERRS